MSTATTPSHWTELTTCAACGSTAWAGAGVRKGTPMRKCRACGTLRYSAVAPPEEIYQDGYHDGTADYGWDSAADEEQAYENAVCEQRLAWLETKTSARKIIDVGGGLGRFAHVAQGRGWDATLAEVVPAAVDYARDHFGVPAKLIGVEDLAAEDEQWPVITLLHVVEHLPDALGVLRALRDAVTPDGIVYVELPNHASLSRRINGERWFGWQPGQHISFFTPSTLSALMERAGYDVLETSSMVPGWDGLSPDTYAHFLGLEPVLNKVVDARRGGSDEPAGDPTPSGEAGAGAGGPASIREQGGLRKLVFGNGFQALRWVEERTGLGTNLRVLARPR